MFKALKDSWREARKKVEEEDRARAAAAAAAAAKPAPAPAGERDMSQVANAFVAYLGQRGVTLDFSPASLSALDEGLASVIQTCGRDPKTPAFASACIDFASYVGEVLRREEGGIWDKGQDGLAVVDLGSHIVPVTQSVLLLMIHGSIPMPNGPVTSLAAYFAAVSAMARDALEAAVRGRHDSLDSLRREISDDPKLSEWLSNQAQLAVKTAGMKWDIQLDFSPESLQGIENILAQLHDHWKNAPEHERPTEKQIEPAVIVWGVYVGEVLRRHYGGKWSIGQPGGILQLEIKEAQVFPVRKVQKRILDGPGDAIPFYFRAMATALK